MQLFLYDLDAAGDSEPVCALQQGDYNVGRGSLLKCNDSRISRNHALISIKDDEVSITSTHPNPCFYQAAGSKNITILTLNTPTIVNNGDKFGFLPNIFWYRTKITNNLKNVDMSTSNKRFNDDNLNDHIKKHAKLENSVECNMDKLTERIVDDCESNESLDFLDNANLEEKVEPVKSESSDHDNSDHSLDLLTKDVMDDVNNDGDVNNDQDVKEAVTIDVNVDLELLKQENDVKTEEGPESKYDASQVDTAENSFTLLNTLNYLKSLDKIVEDEGKGNDSQLPTTSTDIVQSTSNGNGETNADPNTASGSDVTHAAKVYRERCKYGSRCYRKNIAHKNEFSHPGDQDYDTDPEDTRPVCIYGLGCYRKNKLHRTHYRHPKSTRISNNRRNRNRTIQDGNETPPDDYDFDDPFLDDSDDNYTEESWSESESEFLDSQDVDEEDSKSLLKEARKFMKR